MKNLIFAGFILFGTALFINGCIQSSTKSPSDSDKSQMTTGKAMYRCEMDTDVKSDKPGKCPKCGMDLEKMTQKK